MFTKKQKASPIDSLIGSGSVITGDVSFTGGLRVDGEIRGNIAAAGDKPGTLVISEKARVEGEIRADRVVVNGEVVGPLHATQSLELMPKARVSGDVYYQAIEVHVGAIVTGRLVHGSEPARDKVVELRQLQAANQVKAVVSGAARKAGLEPSGEALVKPEHAKI